MYVRINFDSSFRLYLALFLYQVMFMYPPISTKYIEKGISNRLSVIGEIVMNKFWNFTIHDYEYV